MIKKLLTTFSIMALSLGAVSAASANVTFSNVVIRGSLSAGASFNTGACDIDFIFPSASVGDNLPARIGNIVITYEATAVDAISQDQMLLAALGALSGSGTIYFNEVVEDLDNPGVIATYNVVLDSNSQLPHTATLNFSRPSTHVKVKKTLVLTAVDTEAFDLANVSLVEQRLIPEPASLLLLLLGLPLLRRS